MTGMLLLLLVCSNLPEGSTREPRPFQCSVPPRESGTKHDTTVSSKIKQPSSKLPLTSGANTHKGETEEFTNDRTETSYATRKPITDELNHSLTTSEVPSTALLTDVTTKQLPTSPPTSPSELELISDQVTTKMLTTISATSPTERGFTSDQQTTKQESSTLPTTPTEQSPTYDNQTAEHLTSISRGLTSDRHTTKKQTSTSPTSTPERESTSVHQTTDQQTSTASTSPTARELTSDQQTTKPMKPIPSTSPPCLNNMVLGPSCDCNRTCQYPSDCNCTGPQTCVCPDGFLINEGKCVREQECGCYHQIGNLVVPDGNTYFHDACSGNCTCNSSHHLSCSGAFECGPNATCKMKGEEPQCYCNDGFTDDDGICKRLSDCYDVYQAGQTKDGDFFILPDRWTGSPIRVWCDMTTSGGGWTILQRRLSGGKFGGISWKKYRDGFQPSFKRQWLGNEKIFYLTNQRNYVLRFDLVFSNNSASYQEYSLFKISDESDKYRLINLGNSSGTAGDGMNGTFKQRFSTKDRDNDGCNDINCPRKHGDRGWWYSNVWCETCCQNVESTCFQQSSDCNKTCTKANLNGVYDGQDPATSIFWNGFYNIKSTEMKIRPANRTAL